MRERKDFAERTKTKKSDEAKKKYFLVYEGEETEVIYFDAINDMKEQIDINPIIELKPLIRSYSEAGWSNPKKILDRVIQNIEESQTNSITYETLINRIIDYLREEQIITRSKAQANSIWDILKWYYEKEIGKALTDKVEDFEVACKDVCRYLEKEATVTGIVANISDIIKNEKITYEEGFDKICLIVDRDKGSFVSNPKNNQYEYVLKTCREKGIAFYLTNPCFEFWLLLHFEQVTTLDKVQLLENPKVTAKKTYTEKQLNILLPGYKKSSYDAHMLVKMVSKAIENEKLFCEDIELLESNVGSNVGILIKELKN
jgi:hypothetical protein